MNTSSKASENELADLYLRDRDVECPSCGYNRRDGKESPCPECGCAIALQVYDRDKPLDPQRVIRLGILFLVLYSAGYVISNTASLITILVDGTIPATLVYGVMYFGGHIFWMATLYWTARLWSRARKGMLLELRHFVRPAVAVVCMTFFGVVLHVYAAVLSIISVL